MSDPTPALPVVKLIAKEEVAADTMSFRFEKPDGFVYVAGQFADYTIVNPPETDAEGDIRGFSLSSAPYEPFLMATTRMRDTAYKHVLRDAPIGSKVLLDAPWGSFTLHHKIARPAVFLTGGIGITPVRSIVLQSVHDNTGHTITVFDSNKRPENAAFLDELSRVAAQNERITFVPTMSGMDGSEQEWTGETGHIDKAMLSRHLDDLTAPIYYLCGPGAMVKSMRGVLDGAGVDSDDIRTEEFTGY